MQALTEYWSGEEYDCQYAHLYQKSVAFVRRQIIAQGARRLLDVCCGTGLVSIPLTRYVLDATGIDISPAMLRHACYKSRRIDNINFVKGDARDFQLGAPYDIAVVSGNALQSFTRDADALRMLRNIARHLSPNGRLIFDSRLPLRHNVEPSLDYDFGGVYFSPGGEKVSYFAKRERFDAQRSIMHFRKRRLYPNGDVYESLQQMRYRSVKTVTSLLNAAGFGVENLHRNWSGDLLKPTSLQMVCVAQKGLVSTR
ncbi:class I SAM-dependent methyltransferase [Vibrio sp. SM6]|uniref:Class I SAM-dependent methyltransferase n=1 Tax=Vibrio agarilyticus TaxID=2726741 RepID=A0A7X8TQ95_9VIBR|nr:class I SAM-dependent methyltransferase [Vibrio agarilyticus]NLS12957.1 class I SAM-dependent methyltransferase [Vibrio agarilyticus]